VVPNVNGHDPVAIEAAIEAAKKISNKPTMICCKTVIGLGSPNKANTHEVHGAALGDAEIAAARPHIGWNHLPFEIPQEIYELWDGRAKGKNLEEEWNQKFNEYAKKYPIEAAEFTRRMSGELPANWREHVDGFINRVNAKEETIASRKASQNAIEGLAPVLPELIGGSADLAGSNLTLWSGSKGISRENGGNYVYYGVREFGMSAMMNGLSLHGGIIPYGATFLMFSEYARNALRMAALMKIRNLFVFTHDSIGLGEDGPTHQPVEQTATLRYIPNMDVWRPCDTVESAVAWARAIERMNGPSTLIFSRQNLPFQKRDAATIKLIDKGGYILSEAAAGKPQAILIATGSEIGLAMSAQKELAEAGIHVRVVSMPCTNLFDRQDQSYRDRVLIKGVRRVAVEAGISDFWRKYVGLEGAVVGMETFGESAPANELFKHFGFTVENVVKTVKGVI
jgi:transketolase